MKYVVASLLLMIATAGLAQGQAAKKDNPDSLPYQKYHGLPAMTLLLPDSVTTFSLYNAKEGRPIVLFFFSPDCEHCQITTKNMLAKMDSLKSADFYFMTPMWLSMLRPFIAQYRLNDYKNIIVAGKDYQYLFPRFYGATSVPYIVVYDKHKQFVKLWEGGGKMSELIRVVDSLK